MKIFFIVVIIFFSAQPILKAQTLREVKEKYLNTKSKSQHKKNEEKSPSEVDSMISKMLKLGSDENAVKGFGQAIGSVSPSLLPDAYEFSYLYRIRMKSARGNMDVDYFLTRSGNYLGNEISPQSGVKSTIVYDYEKRLMVNYFNGKPMVMKIPVSGDGSVDAEDTVYFVKDIPNRIFLGYDCFGKQMENEEHILTIYVAPGLGVGMCNPFEKEGGSHSPGIRLRKKEGNGGLIMFMDIKDKKNKGDKNTSGTMECILFEERSKIIKNR